MSRGMYRKSDKCTVAVGTWRCSIWRERQANRYYTVHLCETSTRSVCASCTRNKSRTMRTHQFVTLSVSPIARARTSLPWGQEQTSDISACKASSEWRAVDFWIFRGYSGKPFDTRSTLCGPVAAALRSVFSVCRRMKLSARRTSFRSPHSRLPLIDVAV